MVHLLTATLPGHDRHLAPAGDRTLVRQRNALLLGDGAPAEAVLLTPGSARVLRALGRVTHRWTPLGPYATLIRTVPERGNRRATEPDGGAR
ncbi:hypothetical protein [Streptomyces seoulensis]|uniref:hypothetical protein n=1 Tax=Streptomyces seoulensis TaxID=73044 RepID=UPI0033AFC4AB